SMDIMVNIGGFPTNLPPTLSLAASALNVPASAPVTFTATASDSNGDALAYQWLCSDNTSASTAIIGQNSPSFTRSFATAGQYVVTCVVSDMKGGTAVRYVLVTVGSGNARFSISGRITLDGAGLRNVVVSTGAGNGVLSDSDGYYTVPNLTNGTYSIAPLLYGYAFAELFNNSVLVGPNFAGGDFAAELVPTVAVTASTPTGSEAGATPGKFTLTRTGSDADPLVVRVVPVFGTAGSGDYTLSPTQTTASPYNNFTIPAGTNTLDILVTPVDDAAAEGPETVVLQLGIDSTYVIAGNAAATVTITDNDTALPMVSILPDAIAAVENSATTAKFTLTRSAGTTTNLTVNLTYSGTAGNGVDYTALPASVVIPAGSASTTLTVTPIDDSVSEGFESVLATISTSGNYFRSPNALSATNTIVDDDLQVVTLAVADAAAKEVDLAQPGAAPDTGVFTVSRTGDVSQPLTIYYATSGSALHGVDYESLPGSLTFPAGEARASLVITPRFDGFGEGPETVTVQLAAGGSSYKLGAVHNGTLTIADAGDPPYVEVVPWVTAREPSTVGQFRFTLKGSAGSNIVVNYTMSGTAVSGTDYTNVTGSITINGSGTNNTGTLFISPINNSTSNELRTVTVTITPGANYQTWPATASATLWLYDDEQPTVFVDAHTAANNELTMLAENTGTAKFYVSRTGSTNAALTVNYTMTGTATNGVDYQTLSGTTNIAAGWYGVDVVVTPINGTTFEGTRTITLSLAPGAYGRGPDATIYLVDNDAPTRNVGFYANGSVAAESAGTVNIPVRLSSVSATPVTVEYLVNTLGPSTSGTSTSTVTNVPYWLRLTRTNNVFRGYHSTNGTAWFQLGTTTTNMLADPLQIGFAVCSRSDGNISTGVFDNVTIAPDPGGAFTGRDVGFVSAFGGYGANAGTHTVQGSGGAISGTADDFHFAAQAVSGNFEFTARVVSNTGGATTAYAGLMAREDFRDNSRHAFITEQGTNQVQFFTRTNSAITASGFSVDYDLTPGVLTFAPGETSNSIPVVIRDDTMAEPNEQIVLMLRNAYGAVTNIASHVLTIQDNDAAPLQPSVGFAAAASTNAESGIPLVLAVLSQPATNSVTVDYRVTGGTATADSDFTLAAGTLTFAPGQTAQAVPVALINDTEIETNETVIIVLTNATGATLTTLTNHTLTLTDNDLPLVTLAATSTNASESGVTGAWTLTRTGDISTNLTVNYVITGTAVNGTDYATLATNFTFDLNAATGTVTLTPLADALIEGTEAATLTLTNGAGYLVTTPRVGTVFITDTNTPTVTITATVPNASENGPTAGEFTVTRAGPTNASLTVNFTVTGTASNGVDFASIGTSIVIPAGAASAVLAVTPLEDPDTEGPEYVVLSLTASANYVIGGSGFASVTVDDNDSPPTVLISSPGAKSVQLASGNGLSLVATASDDGAPNPLTYAWSQFSGPGNVTFSSTNTTNTTAAFPTNGIYILRITVADGQFTARDDVTVQVGGYVAADWMDVNLGAASTRGKSGLRNGVFTVTGSGTGFSATTDSAHFVCRQVNGVSSVTARITSFAGTTTNAFAGVMVRERNFRGSRRVAVGVRTNGAVELRTRTTDSGANTTTSSGTVTLPVWVKIERNGDTVTAYQAPDVGGTAGAWAVVGSAVTLTTLRADSELGVTASNGGVNTLADATFDNVTLTPAPSGAALTSEDMGSTTLLGSSTVTGTTNVLMGGNSLNSDGGHFRFQQLLGDVTIVARIQSSVGIIDGSKGVVMVRDTSLDNAPFGLMGMAYIRGGYFTWRSIMNGAAATSLDNSRTVPYWLRVIRTGNSISGWRAPNTSSNTPGTWSRRGSVQVFNAEAPVYVGLGVDSGSGSVLNTAQFDNLTITPGNFAPVVGAGGDGMMTALGSTNLSGAVSDDGLPSAVGATTYFWSQASGPAAAAIADSNSLTSSVTFPAFGVYVLRLNADDGEVVVFDDVAFNVTNITLPPSFTTQPQNLSLRQGSNAIFFVNVTGTAPFTYQWNKDSVPIPNRTNSSLALPNIQPADAGGYSVTVTNLYGTTNSTTGTLTVLTPPVLTAQPQSLALLAGDSGEFFVSASGTAPFTYRWQLNSTNLPGATASNLVLAGVGAANTGPYRCIVSNSHSSVTSLVATLTVNFPPGIASQPASQGVLLGSNATFTVTASGTAPLNYQWSFGATPISGATNSSLTISNAQPGDAGSYSVTVANAYGTTNSATATLTILIPPSITAPPVDLALLAGADGEFTVTAAGTAPLVYRWQLNDTNLPGATASNLVLTNVTSASAGPYRVIVTNNYGSVTSTVATLAVNYPPTISGQPQSQTVIAGGTTTFTVTAGGTAPLAYQWSLGVAPIADATNSTLVLSNTQPGSAGNYSVTVSNPFGTSNSANATLTVLVPPAITLQPVGAAVLPGTNHTFTVAATGDAPLIYQWRKNGAALPGETNTTLFLASLTNRANGGTFDMVVTNAAGSATSSNAVLRVMVTQRVWLLSRLTDGRVRLFFGDTDGGSMVVAAPVDFSVETDEDLGAGNWNVLARPFVLTNGWFMLEDPDAATNTRRFYRVIER
ncbi:MAG: immunoglobulin domain-containing protein, partial [Verrucomicrobia bacterium]|nr:immunoglobulin domain-containing protein [Verrucomicrobiota bacterium]